MNKKYLISSVSAMVLLLASPVLADETTPDLSSKPITTPTLDYLGKTSAYEITQGTESDYGFINLITDSKGNISKEYYKINLTGPKSVTWSANGDHKISLNLPTSENPTIYKYSINPDAKMGEQINNDLTQDKVDNVIFSGLSIEQGSVINNRGNYSDIADNSDINIKADFIGNQTNSRAIIDNFSSKLGNITGNFIGNLGGPVISVVLSKIGNIEGDFSEIRMARFQQMTEGKSHQLPEILSVTIIIKMVTRVMPKLAEQSIILMVVILVILKVILSLTMLNPKILMPLEVQLEMTLPILLILQVTS